MRSAVTLDARRLITAISTATIPMPIGIPGQGVIVCSFLGFEHPAWCLRILLPGEGARNGPVNQAGRKAGFPCVCWELRESVCGRRWGPAASDCAAVRSPSMGEQLVLGIGRVQTVLAKAAIQLRTGEPESLRGS